MAQSYFGIPWKLYKDWVINLYIERKYTGSYKQVLL